MKRLPVFIGLVWTLAACGGSSSSSSHSGTKCLTQIDCTRACANVATICANPTGPACPGICQQIENNCAATCADSMSSPPNQAMMGCFQQNDTCDSFIVCNMGCQSILEMMPTDLGRSD
jgi:hypothetical protein